MNPREPDGAHGLGKEAVRNYREIRMDSLMLSILLRDFEKINLLPFLENGLEVENGLELEIGGVL